MCSAPPPPPPPAPHSLRLYYDGGFLPPEPNSLRAARGETAFRLNFYKLQILFLLSLPPILINPLFSHYLILFHFVRRLLFLFYLFFLPLCLSVETIHWSDVMSRFRPKQKKTNTHYRGENAISPADRKSGGAKRCI